jgi:transcriptional regulator NrdR family protein
MSLFCPKSWSSAKCLDSRCNPRTNHVRRRHQCQHEECKHRFTSVEVISGAVDLREHADNSSLINIAREIFEKLVLDKEDRRLFDEWLERRQDSRPAQQIIMS